MFFLKSFSLFNQYSFTFCNSLYINFNVVIEMLNMRVSISLHAFVMIILYSGYYKKIRTLSIEIEFCVDTIYQMLIFHKWNIRACISIFFQNKSAINLSAFLQPFSFPKFKDYIKSFLYCDIFKEWYVSFQTDDSRPKWTGKCSYFRALLYVNAYTEVLRGLI